MRYCRIVPLLFTLVTLEAAAQSAPSAPPDTVVRTVELREVQVNDQKRGADDQFNFYRNSKLATTEDILVRMPGVSLIRRGSYGMEPMLRGYSGAQLNLTLDGMKVAGACTDKMDPATVYIEPVNLKSVQVATGTEGSLMGSALGGGVNMTLKDPEFTSKNRPLLGAGTSWSGVNNGLAANCYANLSRGRLAWRVSAVHREADDYTAGGGGKVLYSGMEKDNISTALRYRINAHHDVKADYLGDWGHRIGYPALTMDMGYARAAVFSLTHRYQSLGKIICSSNTRVYANEVIHFMDDTRRPLVPMHMDMPGTSRTAGAYSELTFRSFGRHTLSTRADWYRSYTQAEMTMYPLNEPLMYMETLPANERSTTGLYVKDEWQIDTIQRVQVSLRTDYMQSEMTSSIGRAQWLVFGSFPVSRQLWANNIQVAYSRKLSSLVTAQVNTGYAERLPSPNEFFGYYLYNRQDGYDYLGNPRLRSEAALQAEGSVQFTECHWGLVVSAYYHHIRNYVLGAVEPTYQPATIGARGVKTFTNTPYAIRQGADLTFQYQLHENWEQVSTARFVMGSTSAGKALPQTPPLRCMHMLRFSKGRLLLQGECEWALPQYRNSEAFGEIQSKGFAIVHLRSGYKFVRGSNTFQLGVAIENLTDRYYREHLDFTKVPRPGRNISCSLAWMFY